MIAGVPDSRTPPPAASLRRTARRLRIAAIVVAALGAIGIDAVLWAGKGNSSDDLVMTGYNKSLTSQAERMYGTSGAFMQGIIEDLRQPGTQAALIGIVAALAAGGCLYVARTYDLDARNNETSEAGR
jgi:hypothetical protein